GGALSTKKKWFFEPVGGGDDHAEEAQDARMSGSIEMRRQIIIPAICCQHVLYKIICSYREKVGIFGQFVAKKSAGRHLNHAADADRSSYFMPFFSQFAR